jgi:superfamily II DNA or RNA helicase
MAVIKKSSQLTLHDRLSRLTLAQAAKWLGPGGAKLLADAGKSQLEIDPAEVSWPDESTFQAVLRPATGKAIVVILSRHAAGRDGVRWACSERDEPAAWVALVLSFILDEKTTLGLAAEPPEQQKLPIELLDEASLERRALAEREQRAREEKMDVALVAASDSPWSDYIVSSALSGKTYRVALRGLTRGSSFCACPDFRKNTLGTCKHVLKVIAWAKRKFSADALGEKWVPEQFSIHIRYDGKPRLALETPGKLSRSTAKLCASWKDRCATSDDETAELFSLAQKLEAAGENVLIFPDAEERIAQTLHRRRLAGIVAEIRKNPATHPLRTSLLKTELLPYQLDGIAFAAGAGRAVLADEMGLGKTIQGVGMAEFLAQNAGISRVLIICPASLKGQWAVEIGRFSSGRTVQLISGKLSEREVQYASPAFFTVCNYEQVLRDFLPIERAKWDLIILDEGQRIKNWEVQTARIVKSLRSRFALVLTGTPIENRIDDLFSILEFIDDQHLGPAFRFLHRYRTANEFGKVLGYKNLAELRRAIAPVLLRRTRVSVALDLPPRTKEIISIEPTDEQLKLHRAHMQIVLSITQKKFITEMDLMRLRRSLGAARMAANSTFLVDKQPPGYSTKLERLNELLTALIAEPERKIIVFSEWTTMLDLIEPLLRALGAHFVRLDGSVPQAKRKQIVAEFQRDAKCRVFLTTNAGSTGLNLQAADTVINVDLPWNPALLDQRIARAHRMGQKRKVHVYMLISEKTIEEGLLATLGAKHELANAVLDPDSDLTEVELQSGTEALKRRLEILLGAQEAAAEDRSVEQRAKAEAAAIAERKARVSEAGGQLLGAAFSFLGQLIPATGAPNPEAASAVRERLAECVETGEDGRPRLTVTLPNADALNALAEALARLMAK